MYNNPYIRNYNQQNLYDQIDNEINNLQQMKEKMKNQQPMQPTNLTQNFQLAPTNREVIRYANSIEDVQKDNIVGETPYFSKDLSVCWIKNLNGSIRSFELTEIIPKDEKDIKIEFLQAQIEELKKGMTKDECNTNVDDTITKSNKDEKSTSISTISKTKTK